MPDTMRHLVDFLEARPFETLATLAVTVLYLRMMMSGPRVR